MAEYVVSRSVEIAAPRERILPLLVSFPQWRRWSPFEDADPELVREYRGAESGVGAEYEWSGNARAGSGVMTITDVTDSRVAIRLQFLRPFRSGSEHTFDLDPSDEGTRVTWTMAGEQRGFMGLVSRLLMPMEKAMGPTFEQGLASLRSAAEA